MPRRRLWELSCPAKDAVLWTSFDRDELLRIADAVGFELEFRRSLDFLGPKGRQFAVSSNFTFVDSNIDLQDVQDVVITTRVFARRRLRLNLSWPNV